MTSEEEVLLEQFFSYRNMDKTSRNFYINLILNLKELTDSEFNQKNSPSTYDLVYLNLNNEGRTIRFEGASSNGIENRSINGYILKEKNGYIIYSDIYRFIDSESDEDKMFHVTDEFIFKDNEVLRKSSYKNGKEFASHIKLRSDEEMESYFKSKIGMQMKR